MALKGIFVGINKQLDPNIDELTGAVRDATALNALFLDSIPGFSARLLVDEAATKDNVSEAIFGTLANAADDDVVVISFAGHGSPDGGIAVYDTLCTDLAGTHCPWQRLETHSRRPEPVPFCASWTAALAATLRLESWTFPRSREAYSHLKVSPAKGGSCWRRVLRGK